MKQSPMFKHAIESFQHGLEHYLDGSERSRKFALLHIDQAIELMLKEKIVQLGKSIYKSDGTTLSLHESFNSLKDLKLKEQPRLEELHDLRNTVQHKGLTPDPDSTQFFIEIANAFVKRFLKEELDISYDSILSPKYSVLLQEEKLPEFEGVFSLLDAAEQKDNPVEKIITVYTALQRVVDIYSVTSDKKPSFRKTFKDIMSANGNNPQTLKPYLTKIMILRNNVVHSDYSPTIEEADSYYQGAWALLRKVGITKGFKGYRPRIEEPKVSLCIHHSNGRDCCGSFVAFNPSSNPCDITDIKLTSTIPLPQLNLVSLKNHPSRGKVRGTDQKLPLPIPPGRHRVYFRTEEVIELYRGLLPKTTTIQVSFNKSKSEQKTLNKGDTHHYS